MSGCRYLDNFLPPQLFRILDLLFSRELLSIGWKGNAEVNFNLAKYSFANLTLGKASLDQLSYVEVSFGQM